MDRQGLVERFKILVPLAAGVYLGFYIFGLVMGVFTFKEVPGLHAIAAVCLAIVIAYFVARRHGINPVDPDSPLGRSARTERERRGF